MRGLKLVKGKSHEQIVRELEKNKIGYKIEKLITDCRKYFRDSTISIAEDDIRRSYEVLGRPEGRYLNGYFYFAEYSSGKSVHLGLKSCKRSPEGNLVERIKIQTSRLNR